MMDTEQNRYLEEHIRNAFRVTDWQAKLRLRRAEANLDKLVESGERSGGAFLIALDEVEAASHAVGATL